VRVTKEKGIIKHHVDRMPSADAVHGVIDWDRRYKHMRMHTSQHLMSGLVVRTYAPRPLGNQAHMDSSRGDLQPANFTADDLKPSREGTMRTASRTSSSLGRRLAQSETRERVLMDS